MVQSFAFFFEKLSEKGIFAQGRKKLDCAVIICRSSRSFEKYGFYLEALELFATYYIKPEGFGVEGNTLLDISYRMSEVVKTPVVCR